MDFKKTIEEKMKELREMRLSTLMRREQLGKVLAETQQQFDQLGIQIIQMDGAAEGLQFALTLCGEPKSEVAKAKRGRPRRSIANLTNGRTPRPKLVEAEEAA